MEFYATPPINGAFAELAALQSDYAFSWTHLENRGGTINLDHVGRGRARRSTRLVTGAWIMILIFTGSFQLYREAIPDGIVFLTMAAVLLVSLTGILDRFDTWRWQPRRALVVVMLASAAVALIFTPRHGVLDGITVAVSGILVFIVAWPNSLNSAPEDRIDDSARSEPNTWEPRLLHSAIAWSILGILFCLWELAMYFLGYGQAGRTEFPALSDLLDPLLNTPVGRIIGAAAWLAGGVALARRGRPEATHRISGRKTDHDSRSTEARQ